MPSSFSNGYFPENIQCEMQSEGEEGELVGWFEQTLQMTLKIKINGFMDVKSKQVYCCSIKNSAKIVVLLFDSLQNFVEMLLIFIFHFIIVAPHTLCNCFCHFC